MAGFAGMLSQMVLAHAFGTSLQIGAYFAVTSVTGILIGLAPVVYAGSILPTLMRLNGNPLERVRVTSAALVWTLLLGCGVGLAGGGFSPQIVGLLMPGLQEPLLSVSVQVSRLLWVTVAVSLLVSVLTTVHHSKRRFLRVAGISLLPPVSVALFVFATSRVLGIRSIAAGLLAAGLVQVVVLLPGGLCDIKLRRMDLFHAEVLQIVRRILPVALSLLPFTMAPFIVIYWVLRIEPAAVPFFGYSQSFATVLSVAVGYGIAVVTFPDLAASSDAADGGAFVARVETYLRFVFLAAVAIGLFVGVFRGPLLKLLLERGAFNEASVRGTAGVLPWYAVAAVCVACLNLLRNTYYARKDYRTVAAMGLLITLVLVLLAGGLGHWFSHEGVAAAYACSFALHLFLALVWMRSGSARLLSWSLISYMARVLVVLGISASAAACVHKGLGPNVPLWAGAAAGALVTFALAVTLGLTLIPIREIQRLSAFVAARFVP